MRTEASRLCLVAGIFALYLRYHFLLWVPVALLFSWVFSDGCRSSGVPHSGSSPALSTQTAISPRLCRNPVEGSSARASGWKEYGVVVMASRGERAQPLWKSRAVKERGRAPYGPPLPRPPTATHWPGKEGSEHSPLSPQMKKPDKRDDEFSGSAPRAPSSPPGGLGCVGGCGGDCRFPDCLS